MFTGYKSHGVAQYVLEFPVPATIEQDKKVSIEKCRSFRTSMLYFVNLAKTAQTETQKDNKRWREIRVKSKSITEYVNEHDGWTTVGWFRLGEKRDLGSVNAEKVESYELRIHVSLLVPTNSDIRNGKDNVFNNLKIPVETTMLDDNNATTSTTGDTANATSN